MTRTRPGKGELVRELKRKCKHKRKGVFIQSFRVTFKSKGQLCNERNEPPSRLCCADLAAADSMRAQQPAPLQQVVRQASCAL